MKTHFYLFIFLFIFTSTYAQKGEDPVAVNDTANLIQYGTIEINVLVNDYDPNGENIHIVEVEENVNYYVIYNDSIITITLTEYYSWDILRIEYEIENESGESEDADIVLFLSENPDVPVPVKDVFVMDTQSEMTMDLLANDEYNGTEELDIIVIPGPLDIEFMEDNRSVKVKTGAISGFATFQYYLKELTGNQYTSKLMENDVFIHKNTDQPIAMADTFSIVEGETMLFDVLSNDISESNISIAFLSNEVFIQQVDNKVEFSCPLSNDHYYPFRTFNYNIIDDAGLLSNTVTVYVIIERSENRPIAVNDTLVFPYSDTVFINPLLNDIGNGSSLELLNSDSLITYTNHDRYGTEIREITYRCKNIDSELLSNEAKIIIQVKAPDNIQIEDYELNYVIGDTIQLNPVDYTNFPESIQFSANSNLLGKIIEEDGIVKYSCNYQSLHEFHSQINAIYRDTIIIQYPSSTVPFPLNYKQYIFVKYQSPKPTSILNVNNFRLQITPFGIPNNFSNHEGFVNEVNAIEHNHVDASNNFAKIETWIGDYSNEETLKVSADLWAEMGFDFFAGPISNRYDGDYSSKYLRTWKISKEEIDNHISNYNNVDYQMPEAILNWPANKIEYNGNMYEQADFVDVDMDGIYQPELGDFPKISGDEAILYILNDGRYKNSGSNMSSDSLNVDIFVLVYAFNRPESEIFHNAFFMKSKVINKSDIDYEDFRYAQFTLYDWNWDNQYLACDTNLNTYYFYDGIDSDIYGQDRIVKSVTFLNRKMDKFLTWGDVDNFAEYKYAHMVGRHDGQFHSFHEPLWRNYAPLDYAFPSDIDDPYGWTALTDDFWAKGGIGSIGPNIFNPGDVLYFDMAFSLNFSPTAGYYEVIDESLDNIGQLIECYENDSIPGGGTFSQIPEMPSANTSFSVQLYPNPAQDILHIETLYKDFNSYRIYSLFGQLITENKFKKEINIETLRNGIYLIQLVDESGENLITRKFVKR